MKERGGVSKKKKRRGYPYAGNGTESRKLLTLIGLISKPRKVERIGGKREVGVCALVLSGSHEEKVHSEIRDE